MTTPSGSSSGTATVVFADVVGSTEVRSKLGEVAADELAREIDGVLRSAAERTGGHVVKSLGDGIMATFASASDGVAGAVAMQQAVDRRNRSRPATPVLIRVGLSVGDVTWERDDCLGAPVVEAARLCAVAGAAQVLCTDLLRVMARGRGGQSFTPVGDLELKGIAEPVPTCEIAWEPVVDADPDLGASFPAGLLNPALLPFHGRRAELELLTAAWKDACERNRRIVLVGGEPGAGKTRLCGEVARHAFENGTTVLYGRCDEDVDIALQPFVEILRRRVDHLPPDALDETLGRGRDELARLVPSVRTASAPTPSSDPDTDRYRLFDAVVDWLASMACDSPVLCVFDDLHWADRSTLTLLHHLARAAEPMRLLVLATFRDTDIDPGHPLSLLLADLRRVPGVDRISLDGLEASDVLAIFESVAGQSMRDDDGLALAEAIRVETRGNAYFVGEVIRHVGEVGVALDGAGRWTLTRPLEELGVPAGAREVIGRRLHRLPDDARQVMTAAAVIGRDFSLDVLVHMTGIDEDHCLDLVEAAIAAHLVDEEGIGRYRFPATIVRAALTDELTGTRRARLHRRAAVALEALRSDDVFSLAYHYGECGDRDAARRYGALAGQRARTRLAFDDASALFGAALAHCDDNSDERIDLLIALGESQRLAGNADHRETLLEAGRLAAARGDGARQVEAVLANNRGWSSLVGVDDERVAAIERAIGAGTGPHARLVAQLAVELMYARDRARRTQLADEALTLARDGQDTATLVHVLALRFPTIWAPDTLAERVRNTEEQVRLAAELGDPVARFDAADMRAMACIEAGDVDGVDAVLPELVTLAEEVAQPYRRWIAAFHLCWRTLLDGRLAQAETEADAALRLGRDAHQPDAESVHLAQLFSIRWDQGRVDEILPALTETARGPAARAMRALALASLSPADADTLLSESFAGGFADLPYGVGWLAGMTLYGEVAAQVGNQDASAFLYDALLPYRDQVAFNNGSSVLGSVERVLGLLATRLGRVDDGVAHLARSYQVHTRMRAPAWQARSLLWWSDALRRRGETAAAEALEAQCAKLAQTHGFAAVGAMVERRSRR